MADKPRARRWPWYLGAIALVLALGGWWVNRQLEPNRLTALVLERVGTTLGLELSIDGTPEYALRPEPRLVLPNLVARQPGAATPLLRAVRVEVSLPWDTITGGESLVITRLELDQPVLDLAALTAWQQTRPDAPFELPTLTEGLLVTDGRVVGDGWSVSALALDVPTLAPQEAAGAEVAGAFEQADTTVEFDANLQLTRAGLASDLAVEATGHARTADIDAPFQLRLDGAVDASGNATLVKIRVLDFTSRPPLPDFEASGQASLGETYRIDLAGAVPAWPEGWPVLPEPLSASDSPLGFTLTYEGTPDLASPMQLTLARDETRAEAAVTLPELLAWLDREDASPLPVLEGWLETPILVIGGATLEGVRVEIEQEEQADAAGDGDP